MGNNVWPAVLALAAILTPARADEVYTIKIKKADVGEVVQVEKTETSVTEVKYVDAKGKAVAGETSKETETYRYRETILAQETGRPVTALRRRYDKARVTENGTTSSLPYEGKAVLIERRKDDKYHFRLEGGAGLTGTGADLLDSEFNATTRPRDFERHLLPAAAVKTDETWKPDMASLVKLLGDRAEAEGDASKAEGVGRLIKVYDKGERRYGRFTVHVEIPVVSTGGGPDKINALEGSRLTADFGYEGCLDGRLLDETLTVAGRLEVRTRVVADGTTQIVTTRMESKETDKELREK